MQKFFASADRGIVLTIEALLSLIVAITLSLFVLSTYNAPQFSFTHLTQFQALNDILEVSIRDGTIYSFDKDDFSAKAKSLGDYCLKLIWQSKEMNTCNSEPSGDITKTTRLMKSRDSFELLEAYLWLRN